MSCQVKSIVCALTVLLCASAHTASQTDEAKLVFDGKCVDEMRGGTWKVVYSSAEGPEGCALEVLTERLGPLLLREGYTSTPLVLPLEKAGGEPVKGKRDMIVVGVPGSNATLRSYVSESEVPAGGYVVRTLVEQGRNVVAIAGSGPAEVLWATFDFLDIIAPDLEEKLAGVQARYPGTFFRAKKVPTSLYRTAPETPVRSLFSWGHVIDDQRESFRAMARARFNRVILWNDQVVVNAREVVENANRWGLKVYWGFSWGWTLSGKDGPVDFERLADDVVSEWRTKWRPMGGDGIYFQSFTETDKKTIGGKTIPEAVVTLVNAVVARIRAEAADLDIVFGLHSNSMRYEGAEEALARLDPSLEILWENCGGFPYWEAYGRTVTSENAFVDKILSLTPSVGLAWKDQLRMDWKHYVSPAGPFLLGRAGSRVLERDREVVRSMLATYDEDWVINGRAAYDHIRHVRAGKHPPREFNAVVEYNPPYCYATQVAAELFWSASDSWEAIARRARMRACPER